MNIDAATIMIRELLDCLPGSSTWAPGGGDGWRCWNALSNESQKKVVKVRNKATMLLLGIESAGGQVTALQELRQKITDALARVQAARPATGMDLGGRLMMQGAQAGSAAMLETVLDWIDEVAVENEDELRRTSG